jgi:DNA repair protein RadC
MSEYQSTPLNIKAWAEEDRPREKLVLKGKSALSDAEHLGILIGSGIRNMTAVDLAKVILQNVGNDLNQLAKLNVKDLSKFKGIGQAKAITIVSALELGRRRKEVEKAIRPNLNTPEQAYIYLKPFLLDLPHEEFWVLILNQASEVIKTERISSGGVTGTIADPKIIFKLALEHLGTSILLCHNHPSGNLTPSQADISLTKKLFEAGKLLDIYVSDHIIFGNHGFYSFKNEGLL